MNAVAFKCPSCGCYLTDEADNDILICPHCGTSITKVIPDEVQILREKRSLFQAIHNRDTASTISLALILIGCVIFGITAHYLGI